LRARRSAVDFVGENDVGEKSGRSEIQIPAILDCRRSRRERRWEGKSEVNWIALKAAMKRFCQGLRESGLADSGNVFDQQVAARKQGDERELDGVFFAVDGARNGALELRDDLGRGSPASVENPGPSCYK